MRFDFFSDRPVETVFIQSANARSSLYKFCLITEANPTITYSFPVMYKDEVYTEDTRVQCPFSNS